MSELFAVMSESALASAAPWPGQDVRLQNPRKLVAHFASIVTEQTPVGKSCIAKTGDMSLFRTFQRMMPQVQLFIAHNPCG